MVEIPSQAVETAAQIIPSNDVQKAEQIANKRTPRRGCIQRSDLGSPNRRATTEGLPSYTGYSRVGVHGAASVAGCWDHPGSEDRRSMPSDRSRQ